MSVRPPLTGLVLAGGASRRMGTDKARLEVGGRPLVARLAGRLATIAEDVLIASGDGVRLADLGYPEVADAEEGSGPLAGIVAGLEVATTPLVAVVAVDLPDASASVLERLAVLWRGETAVVPLVADRVQPLHGVYATASAPTLRRHLQQGERGVTHVLSSTGARVVGADVWGDLDPEGRFARNLNTPEEAARYLGTS